MPNLSKIGFPDKVAGDTLTAAELNEIKTKFNLLVDFVNAGTTVTTPTDLMLKTEIKGVGDSLMFGSLTTNPFNDNPLAQTHSLLGDVDYGGWDNYGVSGQPLGNGYNEQPGTSVINSLSNQLNALDETIYSNGIVVIIAGTNDVRLGGSPQRVYNDFKTACNLILTSGRKPIICTHSLFIYQNVNTDLIELDKLLRSGWKDDLGAWGLVDTGLDDRIGTTSIQTGNQYLSTDGQHLNTLGQGIIASLIRPAIERVRIGQKYGVVTPYTTNQSNVPPNYTGLIAPVGNYSNEYDSNSSNFISDINWAVNTADPILWDNDSSGIYSTSIGAITKTKNCWTRYFQLQMPLYSAGSTNTKVELLNNSNNTLVIPIVTVNQYNTTNNIGPYIVLDALVIGDYYVRVTCLNESSAIGGFRIKQ